MFNYFAWIPNVRGRLSFSQIGTSTLPYSNENIVFPDKTHLVIQKRNLNDSSIPRAFRWLLHFISKIPPISLLFLLLQKTVIFRSLLNQSGDFVFCYVYKEEGNSVIGSVYLVPVESISSITNIGWSGAVPTLNFLKKMAKSASYKDNYSLLLKSALKANSLCHLDTITIERCGLASLSQPKLNYIKPANLKWSAMEGVKTFEDIEEECANQAYYFIKDICHQHQHHHAKTDTILLIQKIESTNNTEKNIEELAYKVINTLYRLILNNRRCLNQVSVSSNKGIMTYLKSFKKNFCEIRKINLNDDFSADGDEFLVESLDNAMNQKMTRKEIRFSLLSTPIVYSLSLFSVFVTMSSLLIVYTKAISPEAADFKNNIAPIEISPLFKGIAEILLGYPHLFFTGLISLIALLTILSRANDFLLSFPIVSDLYRNLYTLRKSYALFILYVLGAVFVYIGMSRMYNLF